MAKKKIIAALEDAGYENVEVTYSLRKPRGYSFSASIGRANVANYFIGKNGKTAMKTIAAMPDPNKEAKTQKTN